MMVVLDTAVLLAAGYGKRMGSITQRMPKPIVPFLNRPMMDWGIERLKQAGIKRVFINGFYLKEQIKDHLRSYQHIEVHLIEEPILLETGGGVKAMLPFLPDHFIVLNCDIFWQEPEDGSSHNMDLMAALMTHYDPHKMDGLLGLIAIDHAHGYQGIGDFNMASDLSIAPIERNGNWVFMGVQILNKSGFNEVTEDVFSLNLIYNRLIKTNRLYGYGFTGKWFHIGDMAGLQAAEQMITDHIHPFKY